ncbi:MAG: 2OG-Fe(II) oxygenase [Acidobacteria bacterium]|nr:2OG-Fe(II) oxygenase [Acidobacteriota bacterium]
MAPHSDQPKVRPADRPWRETPPIFMDRDFLDAAACRHLRAAMDLGTAEPAEVFGRDITLDLDARRASSIEIDPAAIADVETRLDSARAAIAAFHRLSLATREGPSFLRYQPGGFYRCHRDRAVDSGWPEAALRLISLVLFLNSSRSRPAAGEFSGGALMIYPEPADTVRVAPLEVVPRRGCLVAFHAALLHEVLPVRAGTRDVIVDWYY